MTHPAIAVSIALVFLMNACGDKPEAKGGSASFGDGAFTTYEEGGFRVLFASESTAVKTWRNMNGPAVKGTYVKKGNDIEVKWDPGADHHGSLSERFRQMGPCSMARYERVDKKGAVITDSPQIYQKTKPKCDTVRLSN